MKYSNEENDYAGKITEMSNSTKFIAKINEQNLSNNNLTFDLYEISFSSSEIFATINYSNIFVNFIYTYIFFLTFRFYKNVL